MALPFLEQQVHDVDSRFQGLGQRNTIGCGGAGWRPPNLQRCSLPDRDDLCDRSIAVKYRDGLAATNRPKVLAEMRLEFGDTNLLHGLMMTISGLIGK